MLLDPFNALGNFILGLIRTGQFQGWMKLLASTVATAFVSFWGTWGFSIWAIHRQLPEVGYSGALVLGFASACISMAALVYLLWVRSPLTKGIAILVPAKVAEQAAKEDFNFAEHQ